MKIKCKYCSTMFDDTHAQCPYCGAPNDGVVRTTGKQPLTIRELQDWYQSKGLPPYETTRFFIGINYTKPRAFGIYQDERTGNFVVYKNKANGQRAIRYQGTDEAYAVNELFQRLKEEIIQQKKLQVNKAAAGNPPTRSASSSPVNSRQPASSAFSLRNILPLLVGIFVLGFVIMSVGSFREGYYAVKGDTYFCYKTHSNDNNPDWYRYDAEEDFWNELGHIHSYPLFSTLTARSHFLSEDWSSDLGVPDFRKTETYIDRVYDHKVKTGYYSYNDNTYYHSDPSADIYWYLYDEDLDDWSPVESYDVPEDLKHQWLAQDFYYTPDWDSETQIYDFTDSAYYHGSGDDSYYSDYDDDDDYRSWDDDDDDWDWDWDDDWDSGSTDWDSDW